MTEWRINIWQIISVYGLRSATRQRVEHHGLGYSKKTVNFNHLCACAYSSDSLYSAAFWKPSKGVKSQLEPWWEIRYASTHDDDHCRSVSGRFLSRTKSIRSASIASFLTHNHALSTLQMRWFMATVRCRCNWKALYKQAIGYIHV